MSSLFNSKSKGGSKQLELQQNIEKRVGGSKKKSFISCLKQASHKI